ncbi:MAG: hypothetical protein DRO23_09145 [Thermoprotei archaeon]|nr:MAG: hypothetical protein DRO23_09145 [Thermoprotei archaeon]
MHKPKKKYKTVRINIPFEEYIVINEIIANKGYKSVSEWVRNIVTREIRKLKNELQPSGWVKLDVDPLNFIDALSKEFMRQCTLTYGISSMPFKVLAKDYSEQERIVSDLCKLLEASVYNALKLFSADKLLSTHRCYAEPHKMPFASLVFYIDEYPYSILVEGSLLFDEQLRASFTIKGLRISGDLVLTYWHKKLFEILVRKLGKWNPRVEEGNVLLTLQSHEEKDFEKALLNTLKEFGEVLGSEIVSVDSYVGVNSVKAEGGYSRNNIFYTIVIDGIKEEIKPEVYNISLRLTA